MADIAKNNKYKLRLVNDTISGKRFAQLQDVFFLITMIMKNEINSVGGVHYACYQSRESAEAVH